MNSPTIYQVADRIKNLARGKAGDATLLPNGEALCNLYTHVLMSFYAFAETLPEPYGKSLYKLIESKENLPAQVISLVKTDEDD